MKKRLLLVTENERILKWLLPRMNADTVETVICPPGQAPGTPTSLPFDVALIDTEGLGQNAIDVLRELRRSNSTASLLACAVSDTGVDAVLAYESGADDYFSSSIDLTVIEAKLRRALARTRAGPQCPGRQHTVPSALLCAGLTRFEHRLLRIFEAHSPAMVHKSELVRELWGHDHIEPKRLYEHISTLRMKLGTVRWTLVNVRSQGYRLKPLS